MEEKLIIAFLSKMKYFFYWFLAGGIVYMFEIQAGNIKWNLGKFLISSITFWFLTEFSFLLIEGNFIGVEDLENESRVIVMSILIATTLYLFLPFILRKENREKFITTTLERFGYIKLEKNDKNKN